MSTSYDFKEAARKLMDQIASSTNKDLVKTAVEVALRDAFDAGVGVKKKALTTPKAVTKTESACNHQWRESFLDGRAVGVQCANCGVLEKDVKTRCDHFFVKSGKQEVCVACRAVRKSGT